MFVSTVCVLFSYDQAIFWAELRENTHLYILYKKKKAVKG